MLIAAGNIHPMRAACWRVGWGSTEGRILCLGWKPGAGDGSRTRVTSLEGWSSTVELRPRRPEILTGGTRVSGRRDSNPRPPAPKAGALTKLRYSPHSQKLLKSTKPTGQTYRPNLPVRVLTRVCTLRT